MIEWRDEGVLLSARRHGETSMIIEVFTEAHGRHAGVVRGGTSRKISAAMQPGTQLDVVWKARLEEHIGSFTIEPLRGRAAGVMQDRRALAGLNAITGLLIFAMPEREVHLPLYERSVTLMDLLVVTDAWPLAYLQWELALLEGLGYGLDLTECAATGAVDDLCYVSPKSGRAVSRAGAGAWADRLLPLPECLLGRGDTSDRALLVALETTGYFLQNHLAKALGDRPLPEARARLLEVLARHS